MSTTTKIISIIILLFLVFLSAFFSGAETAYSSIKQGKLQQKIKEGKKAAKLIERHYRSFGWTLATILISNNLVNIGASSLTTYLFTNLMGSTGTVTIVSTLAVTPIIVIFGEIFPKIMARKYSYKYLSKVVYIMHFLNIVFSPITYPLSKFTKTPITNTEKEIKSLLRLAKKEGVLEGAEATLAQKALDLDSKLVKSIMVKKEKILWVNHNAKINDVKKIMIDSGFSRLPVKKDKNFMGFVILKDIVLKKTSESIEKYILPLFQVSQSKLLSKALEEMRINKMHIAIVTNSSNSSHVKGLITIEDIIEELVGEIYDEHDSTKLIREINHHKFIAYGSAKMSDIISELNFEFENHEDLTIKQWIQSRIQRKIKKNLRYEYKDKILFRVIKNNNKTETLIEITKKN